MPIAHWCIPVASLLPVLTIGLAKTASVLAKGRSGVVYDNNHPREWAARLTGWQQRAHAAEMNGFEALPLFIAVVILAQQAHADQGRIDSLAPLSVSLRIVYLMNLGTLRSLVWVAGFAVSVAILAMA
jgi:uncharacterized MAPEG superfamily protein